MTNPKKRRRLVHVALSTPEPLPRWMRLTFREALDCERDNGEGPESMITHMTVSPMTAIALETFEDLVNKFGAGSILSMGLRFPCSHCGTMAGRWLARAEEETFLFLERICRRHSMPHAPLSILKEDCGECPETHYSIEEWPNSKVVHCQRCDDVSILLQPEIVSTARPPRDFVMSQAHPALS